MEKWWVPETIYESKTHSDEWKVHFVSVLEQYTCKCKCYDAGLMHAVP